MVVGAKAPRRRPVRSEAHDQWMRAKQNPLFLGEALCVRVDRHLVAPGAIGHRRGPGLHVMQQPLQKVDLILPAHRTSSGLLWPQTDHRSSIIRVIRNRITTTYRPVFQYGAVSPANTTTR